MKLNIELLNRKYFSNYLPCPYKLKYGNEILIYPIKVKDFQDFEDCCDILKVDKKLIPSKEVIEMSQLQFLKEIIFANTEKIKGYDDYTIGDNELEKLRLLFKLCLNEDYINIGINEENNKYVLFVGKESEDENDNNIYMKYYITNKEFLDISKIILFQNFYDYDDRYIDPDVMKEYNEMVKLKYKDASQPTFERQQIYVMSKQHCSIEEVKDMPYRLFIQLYNEYIDIDRYFSDTMFKTAYKYDIKENIIYPLFKKEKDKFDDLFISEDALNKKLGN